MIAIASGAALKLPPSVRDFQVYRFVKFACNSTREAAAEFCLSQTRVRQVLARVIEFLLESAPRVRDDTLTDDAAADSRIVVAEQFAREQLEVLYQRCMKAYDDTHHEDAHGNLLPGKIAYLAAAGRITLWMANLPVHGMPAFREDDEQFDPDDRYADGEVDASDPALEQLARQVNEVMSQAAEARACHSPAEESPPVADCSTNGLSRGERTPVAPVESVASGPAEGTYKSLDEIKAQARRRFLRPAQSETSQNLEPPTNGDDESPGADPPPGRRPLNRKERRARERLRQRIMAKR